MATSLEKGVAATDSTAMEALAIEEKIKTKGKKKSTAMNSASNTVVVTEEKHIKRRIVRLYQSQIDFMLSYNPKPIVRDPDIAEIDDFLEQTEKELLEEKEMIRKQYEEKGYVDYEVFDDGEGPQERAPRQGRRRFRPGVVKHRGQIKRLL